MQRFLTLIVSSVLAMSCSLPTMATIYSWENSTDGFSNIDASVHSSSVTNPIAVTDGSYAAQMNKAGGSTRITEGAWVTDLITPLSTNSTLLVDFAIANPSAPSYQDYYVFISIDGHSVDGSNFIRIEQPSAVRMQAGTAVFDFASDANYGLVIASEEVRLRVRVVWQGGNTEAIYLDNFRFLPEPASLGLMGLGGLLLLRRRTV